MSEQSQRPSRRFEAESVPEIRQKLADFDCPFGHIAAHNALRLLLRSHDDLVGVLGELIRQIANNDFKDSHGHEALRLRAYAEAQAVYAKVGAP